jgi:hypothetical protein
LATANQTDDSVSVFSVAAAPLPSAWITSPSNGAIYMRGELIDASFGCVDGANGPGVSSCAGTVADGAPIDTGTLGRHTLTVIVKSRDGRSATSTVSYTVIEPSNYITVSHIKTHADGTITFQVKVPGPGTLDVLQTAQDHRLAHARVFVSGRAHVDATQAGVLHLQVAVNAQGKRLVQHHPDAIVLRLLVTYTPTGGTTRNVGFSGLHLPSGPRSLTPTSRARGTNGSTRYSE